jgi:hypothetical protein
MRRLRRGKRRRRRRRRRRRGGGRGCKRGAHLVANDDEVADGCPVVDDAA